jgi:hypothetical protein
MLIFFVSRDAIHQMALFAARARWAQAPPLSSTVAQVTPTWMPWRPTVLPAPA